MSCLHGVIVALKLPGGELGGLNRPSEELLEDTEESDFSFAVDGIGPHRSGLLIGDEIKSAVLIDEIW